MPIGTLIEVMADRVRQTVDRAAGPVIEAARIQEVGQDGTLVVQAGKRTVTARPATEEPFLAGEEVWVSRTKRGEYIVHGGRR